MYRHIKVAVTMARFEWGTKAAMTAMHRARPRRDVRIKGRRPILSTVVMEMKQKSILMKPRITVRPNASSRDVKPA